MENVELAAPLLNEVPPDPQHLSSSSVDTDDHKLHNLRWEVAFIYENTGSEKAQEARQAMTPRKLSELEVKQKERETTRQDVFRRIHEAGLQTLTFVHASKEYIVTVVRGSPESGRLEIEAERQGLRLPLKESPRSGGDGRSHVDSFVHFNPRTVKYQTYKRADKDLFPPFNSLTRQRLLKLILEGPEVVRRRALTGAVPDDAPGGAQLDLEQLVLDEVFTDIFPLHEDTERHDMKELWLKTNKKWWQVYKFMTVPNWEVRNYFGEKTAFYFLWLTHYTQWLIPLSLIGIITSIISFSTKGLGDSDFTPVYCALLIIWCDLFIETWKRKSNEHKFIWNVRDFELVEEPRKQFSGVLKRGLYTEGGHFVHVDSLNVPEEPYFSVWQRFLRRAFGLPVISSFVIATAIGTIALLAAKRTEEELLGSRFGPILAGVSNALFITIMNYVYAKVAQQLNDFENHRTNSQHEDALITKTFLFQFINSYISLFFIAFVKRSPGPDTDKFKVFNLKVEQCRGSCMQELFLQLATLVIAKQTFSQIVEVGLPFVRQLVLNRMKGVDPRSVILKKSKIRRQVDSEINSPKFKGTFDEYNEMMIQYGYVTLFAAAFPLAAVSSWINNVIEIQTDGVKVMYGCQRAWYAADDNIGSWEYVLQALSIAAIITNCFLVGFTSSVFRGEYVQNDAGEWECAGRCMTALTRIIIVMAAEHVFLLTKIAIPYVVEDTPGWVHEEIAKLELEDRLQPKEQDQAV
eukprot:c21275_g1_i1.p1 GENE.c21275_g1_i1~~c21275_g1_i1.p1  ORF type:complete len:746 (+),score=195.97 c21275_g1_i1:35-2272(+)